MTMEQPPPSETPPPDEDSPRGGVGGETALEAVEGVVLAHARTHAPAAVKAITDLVTSPERNGGVKLAAAIKVLEIAGVKTATDDARQLAWLQKCKKRLSREAFAEVLAMVADEAGIDGGSGMQ